MILGKISIKKKKSFKLSHQQKKFVLFIGEDRKLDSSLPLNKQVSMFIESFLNLKVFKNLPCNKSIMLHNPLTFEPDFILIIKISKKVDEDQLYDFGRRISQFKEESEISIIWSIDRTLTPVVRTIQLRSYTFDKLYSDKVRPKIGGETIFFVNDNFKYSKITSLNNSAISEGVRLCRDLVNSPANILNTEQFTKELIEFKNLGIKVRVLNEKDIKALGMNLILAVGQGSKNPSKVVILEWKKGNPNTKPTALVGKGVVFDSGGLSLKSSSGMVDMAMDMAGAAVVAGLFKAVALSNMKVNLVGLIGVVENMPGPSSIRPGDIIKSLKGDLVKVNNTDAEGRLLLSDLLWYAQIKFKPKRIFDIATLTGAIIIALGKEYAGVFSNNDKFCDEFLSICEKSREKAWRLPLDDKFRESLNTSFADLSNVGGSQGSSIVAAMFLNNFIKKGTPWIHLDIAGVAKNKETIFSKSGATAWGVISLFEYFQEYS